MSPTIRALDDPAPALAAHLADIVRASAGRLHVALSGGSTPGALYDAIVREHADAPWGKVEWWWSDERIVALDDARSNHRLARLRLLDPLRVDPARVHPVPVHEGAAAAAAAYERALPPALDVVLLGLGADGHVASLFPRSPALQAAGRVAATVGPDGLPRVTLTPREILGARHLHLLATGASKAEAVAASAAKGGIEEVPGRLAKGGTWWLDHAASSALRR